MQRILLGLLVALIVAVVLPAPPGRGEVVDRIVAVVNDDIITMSELQSMAKTMEAQSGAKPTKKEDQEIQRKMLEVLIDRKLAKTEAKKRGISVSDKELEQAMATLRKRSRVTDDEAFAKALAREGLTLKELKQQLQDQMLEERLIAAVVKDKAPPVSEAEVRRIYETQFKGSGDGNQVHLRSIRLTYPPEATDAQKDEIKQKAETVLKEVKQGASFPELARKMSLEETDLGFVSQNDLDPKLAEYISRLKDKEVAPVHTPQGFQLIQLVGRRTGQPRSYEEAAPHIRQMLMQRDLEKHFSDWVKTLREKAHIKNML